MKSVCAFEVVTQYEIVVNGRQYFADIAIPGLMIIFEFDGIGKLGKNEADFAQAKREWIQRENDLRSAGWTIYRVSWPDYEDLVRLRAWVTELLAPYQASIPASAQRLWAVPTQACDGPNRRFHTGHPDGGRKGHTHDRRRCTRYVALHPNRRGVMPTDRV